MKTALLATRTATGNETYEKLRAALAELKTSELHHGAEGAAKEHAGRWALETGNREIGHAPNWAQHGRAAGPIRGKELIKAVDNVVAIWDGRSKGTENELKEAKRQGKKVKLILV